MIILLPLDLSIPRHKELFDSLTQESGSEKVVMPSGSQPESQPESQPQPTDVAAEAEVQNPSEVPDMEELKKLYSQAVQNTSVGEVTTAVSTLLKNAGVSSIRELDDQGKLAASGMLSTLAGVPF